MSKSLRFRLALGVAATTALAAATAILLLIIGTTASATDGPMRITLEDGSIGLSHSELEAGRQPIEVTNAGSGEHEVVVVRTEKAEDELPIGLHGVSIPLSGDLVLGEDHLAEKHGHEPGAILGMLAGESQVHSSELEPGRYVVFCQSGAGAHYRAGEHASFTVRAPG